MLSWSSKIKLLKWQKILIRKEHALFLGRGIHYPVAMEGATLKLKEISYIHAEAYPAGELKHGPLALVDSEMPVVAVAPNDDLLEKLQSNLEEVRARGGKLYVFGHSDAHHDDESITRFIELPEMPELDCTSYLFNTFAATCLSWLFLKALI